jgi:hypothetical protein
MNDTNPPQEQNPTPQPASENSVAADKISPSTQEGLPVAEHPHEKEIDLNKLFPDAETDLNDLFPDAEIKHLLKGITKNKKDMNAMKERLAIENKTPDKEEEEPAEDSTEPGETEDSNTE